MSRRPVARQKRLAVSLLSLCYLDPPVAELWTKYWSLLGKCSLLPMNDQVIGIHDANLVVLVE